MVVPEKSDGGAEGGKRWRREKAAAPEKPELGDSAGERRLRGRKAEMGTSARTGRAKALRKQLGERPERDFASAMGASATQKRSLRNATPDCAAPAAEVQERWHEARKQQAREAVPRRAQKKGGQNGRPNKESKPSSTSTARSRPVPKRA